MILICMESDKDKYLTCDNQEQHCRFVIPHKDKHQNRVMQLLNDVMNAYNQYCYWYTNPNYIEKNDETEQELNESKYERLKSILYIIQGVIYDRMKKNINIKWKHYIDFLESLLNNIESIFFDDALNNICLILDKGPLLMLTNHIEFLTYFINTFHDFDYFNETIRLFYKMISRNITYLMDIVNLCKNKKILEKSQNQYELLHLLVQYVTNSTFLLFDSCYRQILVEQEYLRTQYDKFDNISTNQKHNYIDIIEKINSDKIRNISDLLPFLQRNLNLNQLLTFQSLISPIEIPQQAVGPKTVFYAFTQHKYQVPRYIINKKVNELYALLYMMPLEAKQYKELWNKVMNKYETYSLNYKNPNHVEKNDVTEQQLNKSKYERLKSILYIIQAVINHLIKENDNNININCQDIIDFLKSLLNNIESIFRHDALHNIFLIFFHCPLLISIKHIKFLTYFINKFYDLRYFNETICLFDKIIFIHQYNFVQIVQLFKDKKILNTIEEQYELIHLLTSYIIDHTFCDLNIFYQDISIKDKNCLETKYVQLTSQLNNMEKNYNKIKEDIKSGDINNVSQLFKLFGCVLNNDLSEDKTNNLSKYKLFIKSIQMPKLNIRLPKYCEEQKSIFNIVPHLIQFSQSQYETHDCYN